ncbi:MAG: PD40 domain-containing protein [Anaerolineae bacterium]|nr:PD40 domain-containing protein [Anaerolineae bacterium]
MKRSVRKLIVPLFAAWLVTSACNLGSVQPTLPPTATATETETATPEATNTPAVTATPSHTPTVAATSTITPTPTLAATLTPSNTPTATATVPALPAVAIALDNYQTVAINDDVKNSIGQLWLSFINVNDQSAAGTATPGTTPVPSSANNLATVYLISPATPNTRIKVLDLPASTDDAVYWSPNGAFIAYFLNGEGNGGLYLLSLEVGYEVRLFALDNLSPHGVANPPAWSPDSRQIAITLSTAYDMDIFSLSPDGSNFRNLTTSPAYDFWPVWSPDGQALAFVSDRDVCKTYEPNVAGTCYSEDALPPDGGNLYLYITATGEVRKLSDAWVTSPPRWINTNRLAFNSGKRGEPLGGSSLSWVNINSGESKQVTPSEDGLSALNDAWSPDGSKVVYQEIGTDTVIVVRDENGNELARLTDYKFPRFGFAAAWSLDGRRLVIGGRKGQCPYGMTILNDSLQILTRANPRPSVCDPLWSPDGKYIAFAGVQSGSDGSFDVYLAAPSGGGIRNVTARLGGEIRPLGWVGRAP